MTLYPTTQHATMEYFIGRSVCPMHWLECAWLLGGCSWSIVWGKKHEFITSPPCCWATRFSTTTQQRSSGIKKVHTSQAGEKQDDIYERCEFCDILPLTLYRQANDALRRRSRVSVIHTGRGSFAANVTALHCAGFELSTVGSPQLSPQ